MLLLEAIILSVLAASTPLLLAAAGELVVERAGVLNLGIEGMMIMGAACGFAGACFTGSTLVDQGGTSAKLTGTLLIPHHELVRDTPDPPHGYPKVGDTVTLRLDSRAPLEFGDDIIYVIETARGVLPRAAPFHPTPASSTCRPSADRTVPICRPGWFPQPRHRPWSGPASGS